MTDGPSSYQLRLIHSYFKNPVINFKGSKDHEFQHRCSYWYNSLRHGHIGQDLDPEHVATGELSSPNSWWARKFALQQKSAGRHLPCLRSNCPPCQHSNWLFAVVYLSPCLSPPINPRNMPGCAKNNAIPLPSLDLG